MWVISFEGDDAIVRTIASLTDPAGKIILKSPNIAEVLRAFYETGAAWCELKIGPESLYICHIPEMT